MAKKKGGTGKDAAKATKKAKSAQKVEKKDKKKAGKPGEDDSDEDLEEILNKIQREWEDAHRVTEELVEGPPSRRANAILTPCPTGSHLWFTGGEFFSDDGKAYFYNDVFRYSPDKDEWRRFVSPTCPGPRSAHAVIGTPSGGGKLYLFGGEFSSLHQNSFHHYRDFWSFDITTHMWDRIETKIRPSARSGHRMAMWKHFVVLFGGFFDPGLKTNYLDDLWLFNTQEYKWRQVDFKETEPRPSPRSGFSFLPTPEGILLHGGYCKEYTKGARPVGVTLTDTWFLRMTLAESEGKSDPLTLKWERRKRPTTTFAPSPRSGCTMALWSAKNMGVLFGGVTDEDISEEALESIFHNDMYGYQIAGNGRWVSLLLKKSKKKGGAKQKPAPAAPVTPVAEEKNENTEKGDEVEDSEEGGADEDGREQAETSPVERSNSEPTPTPGEVTTPAPPARPEASAENTISSTPMPRYNAMLAVLRNTLYIYGGIFERGAREYTLDDFYSLQLDKLDRFVCLKAADVTIPADGNDESSDEDDESSDEDDRGRGDDENDEADSEVPDDIEDTILDADDAERMAEMSPEEKAALRSQATAFLGVAKDTARSVEDVISTPLPGETLAKFYGRSREYWAQKAHDTGQKRGKESRRYGFDLAQSRYAVYKPVLKEVERILAEAGLDEEEMKKGAGGSSGPSTQSRNRR